MYWLQVVAIGLRLLPGTRRLSDDGVAIVVAADQTLPSTASRKLGCRAASATRSQTDIVIRPVPRRSERLADQAGDRPVAGDPCRLRRLEPLLGGKIGLVSLRGVGGDRNSQPLRDGPAGHGIGRAGLALETGIFQDLQQRRIAERDGPYAELADPLGDRLGNMVRQRRLRLEQLHVGLRKGDGRQVVRLQFDDPRQAVALVLQPARAAHGAARAARRSSIVQFAEAARRTWALAGKGVVFTA